MNLILALILSAAPLPATSASEADALRAARTGDMALMAKLKGTPLQLSGRVVKTVRDTKAYRDILVVTGPDFKVAGTNQAFEIQIRVPRELFPAELPELITASGTLTDFDPHPEGNRVGWRPVITINFLK